jgi:hypothetical protein
LSGVTSVLLPPLKVGGNEVPVYCAVEIAVVMPDA